MGTLAPEAVYLDRCVAVGIENTMKGDEYVSADFQVTDENGEVYTVVWRGWLTAKTEDRTIESLRLMGWYGDDIYQLARDGATRNKVKLDVRHEEYKGKTTARVSFINAADLDPAATERKREATRERLRKKAQATKPAMPPDDSERSVEDEIPF